MRKMFGIWVQYLHKALKKLAGEKDLASNQQLITGRLEIYYDARCKFLGILV